MPKGQETVEGLLPVVRKVLSWRAKWEEGYPTVGVVLGELFIHNVEEDPIFDRRCQFIEDLLAKAFLSWSPERLFGVFTCEPLFDIDTAFTRSKETGSTNLQNTGLESAHSWSVGSPEAHVSDDYQS